MLDLLDLNLKSFELRHTCLNEKRNLLPILDAILSICFKSLDYAVDQIDQFENLLVLDHYKVLQVTHYNQRSLFLNLIQLLSLLIHHILV